MHRNPPDRKTLWLQPLVCCVAILVALANPHVACSQTEAPIQLIEPSRLPAGAGLAAKLAPGQLLVEHPAVKFAEDFETGELGAKWDEVNNRGGKVLSLVDESSVNASLGQRSLKVNGHAR